MSKLIIKDLHVAVKDKEILKGLSIEFDTDKIDTLDTTGKVIKSDDIYSKFINDFR